MIRVEPTAAPENKIRVSQRTGSAGAGTRGPSRDDTAFRLSLPVPCRGSHVPEDHFLPHCGL